MKTFRVLNPCLKRLLLSSNLKSNGKKFSPVSFDGVSYLVAASFYR